jgi:carboxyl-terminal processing protease
VKQQNNNQTGFQRGSMSYLAAVFSVALSLFLSGGVAASSDAIKSAAEKITVGQWDEAESILNAITEAADPRIEVLKGLVGECRLLSQRRQEQRAAVFEEKCKTLDGVDVTSLDDAGLLKVMDTFTAAWGNAVPSEREGLLVKPIYAALRQSAEKRYSDSLQAGQWDTAWSKWLRWLNHFEPQQRRQAVEDLQERRAMANALRKNPCDEKFVPYAQVKRQTAMAVFEALDCQYAESVPFDRVAGRGLHRLKMLPEVFSNPTFTPAVGADPNGFKGWTEHIDQLSAAERPTGRDGLMGLLDTLLAINQTTLKLPEGVIVAQFTEAVQAGLAPYTEAVWPEDVGAFEKTMTGQFGGVGIRIKKDGEDMVIVSVIPDTPAALTTLAADDIILAVDGQPTDEMTTDCAVTRISGPTGTAVSLTVRHAGADKSEVVTVTRQKIVLPTVEGSQRADNGNNQGHWDYFLDAQDRIGYLHLNGFTDKTAEQARIALEQLEQKQVAGLIIDVRGNEGGLLSEATAFANLFIGDGILLSSKGREDKTTVWQAKSNGLKRSYPIVILIDEDSASASEIVAGVMAQRTSGQAILLGQRTYGKGSVQEVIDLKDASGRLKFTSAYYYLPDGQPVQNRYKLEPEGRKDWGIAPTIDVPLYEYEKTEVSRIQLERRKQLMAKEKQKDAQAQSESLAQQMLMADAQLSAAMVVLKARILAGY